MQFGDENSKFFQAMASEWYRRNNIATLSTDDGICVDDHSGKEALLFHSFKQRLGTSSHNDMKFDLTRIINWIDGLKYLIVPFTTDEIDHVIRSSFRFANNNNPKCYNTSTSTIASEVENAITWINSNNT